MSLASDFRRLRALPWRDRLLLAETVVALASASVAVGLIPFRRIMSSLRAAPPADREPAAALDIIDRVRWAVEACGQRLPWRIVCFQKGLAFHRILRRRGIGTVLHYGVAQGDDSSLKAHVWISYQGRSMLGGEVAGDYVCLATFPAADPFPAPSNLSR